MEDNILGYVVSTNEENWGHAWFATMEEAHVEGKALAEEELADGEICIYSIGEAKLVTIKACMPDVDDFLERMEETAYDYCGEHAEDMFPSSSKEMGLEFEELFTKLLEKHGYPKRTSYEVINVQKFTHALPEQAA